jgi:hypothetical protein
MRRTAGRNFALALCAGMLVLSSCNREQAAAPAPSPTSQAAPPAAPQADPFRVSRIDLGNEVDAQKRVAESRTVFKPNDTIYASIVTEGTAPSVTIVTRWTFEDGQLVSQGSQTIAPNGPTATEFHIAKPSGFPEGRYQVEAVADGASVGVRTFDVKE